jgi:hypothetical protein
MDSKLFYKNLKLFLKELVVVFPEDDEELQIITTSINLAIIDNDETILKNFYISLQTLESDILNRNNEVFNKDPSSYWEKTSYEYKLFTKLNSQWTTFSDYNQKIIWDYIQVLYNISKKDNQLFSR